MERNTISSEKISDDDEICVSRVNFFFTVEYEHIYGVSKKLWNGMEKCPPFFIKFLIKF